MKAVAALVKFLWGFPEVRRVTAWAAVSTVVAAAGVVVILTLGCYPRPPVNPPTCAQDPTQDWCLPPAFARAPDGGVDGGRK